MIDWHFILQLIESNDQLNDKIKEVSTKHSEEEARADELERDLKSLRNTCTTLEGAIFLGSFVGAFQFKHTLL